MPTDALIFFFFSSRRRHTRLQGDWSSDVCSSDLPRALDEQALPAVAAVEKARGGSMFAHRIQVIDGVPYQMSALPIRGDRDQVVGGLLIGVKLQRLFDEFADQSDDQVDMQIRPTLIDGVTILASA